MSSANIRRHRHQYMGMAASTMTPSPKISIIFLLLVLIMVLVNLLLGFYPGLVSLQALPWYEADLRRHYPLCKSTVSHHSRTFRGL